MNYAIIYFCLLFAKSVKENELKKYCCTTQMVADSSIDNYEDVDLIVPNYNLKCAHKIITGINILSLYDKLFSYYP